MSSDRRRIQFAPDLIAARGLPAAPDSERMILAAVMVDGRDRMEEIRYAVDETCFHTITNRTLWGVLCELFDGGESTDRIMVAQSLHVSGKLNTVGGLNALVAMDEGMPRGLDLDSHVRCLHEKAVLRQTVIALNTAMMRVMSQDAPSSDLLAYSQEILEKVALEAPGISNFETARQVIDAAGMDFFQPAHDQSGVAMPDKWPQLRALCPSLRPGQLVILAARTSAGKSALALHLAIETASKGWPVAIQTMEMSKREWNERGACHLAEVDSYRHQGGFMDAMERVAFARGADRMKDLEILFDDRSGITPASLYASVQRMRPRPRLVIVDYLQLMSSGGRHDQRADEVSAISRALKRMATNLAVPVLALSQFSRDNAKNDREPELHDLKSSGDLENDANIAIFVQPDGTNDKTIQPVKVIVKKNRGGRLGRVAMMFHKPYSKFVEASV